MKRIIIVLVLLVMCVWISVYSIHRVGDVTNEINFNVNGALAALAADDQDNLTLHVDNLITFWQDEEDEIVHLVRHSQIDDISKSVARLEALTAGKDYSELAAELSSIRWQMEHVQRSEKLLLQNLL